MLSFREQAAADLDAVFFNAFEFAEKHTISGMELLAVVDHELYNERQQHMRSKIEGISQNGTLLFVKKSDWIKTFKRLPRIGDRTILDGMYYLVEKLNDDMGMLEITLAANDGKVGR